MKQAAETVEIIKRDTVLDEILGKLYYQLRATSVSYGQLFGAVD